MVRFDLQLFAADGHLNFDTKLDEKGFSGGIKKLGSIAKGGLSILGGAVAGVTAAMGAGVTAGLKYNADMQMYMANFSTMLGSQEAATKFVDQLKETAAKTPFEMSDLADASKTLLAFGSTADGANDQIKMLGDISLGNAEKLKTLSTAFGRIQSNGKASMEELNMMIDSGFNPLNIIAAKTGESMESLRKRVSSGGVSFEELNEAMVQATSEGGQFYKGMEKASMTMDGLISTLKDNAMALLGEVVQPLTDQMTDTLLPAAIDTIDQLSQAFREGGVEGLIQAGADILGNLLIGIADQLPGVIETAVSFIDTLIQSFNENMPLLLEAGGALLGAIVQGIITLAPSLLSLGWSIINGIIQGITTNAPQLRAQAGNLFTQFKNGISIKLPELLQQGADALSQFVQGLLSGIPSLITNAGTIISQLYDAFLTALPKILETGVKLIGQLAQGILSNLPAAIGAAAEALIQIVATIASHLPEILQKGIELLGELAAGIIKAIPDLVKKIPEVLISIKDKFMEYDWLQIGKDIVAGIANGLKNAISTVVDAAKEVGEAALDGLKGLLGIHSPSRVFRDEVGRNIALGIGDGIRQNKDYAKKSAEEIAQATLDAAKKKLDNHKVYNKLSLAQEVGYWDEVRKQTAEGTQARIDADKEYLTAKQNLMDQMAAAEQSYTERVASAYKDLNERVKDLNNQYQDAVNQRTDQIKSALGLFDEFAPSTDLTAEDLLGNLQSQVDGLREWRSNLKDLEHRGIGGELLEELQNLGPQAAAQIQLMTEMSDDQLDEYVSLFRQKNRIARKQAVDELKPMREEISDQIMQMQQETSAELAKYQKEYTAAMTELGVSLNQPLENMKLAAAQNAVALVSAMAGAVKEASGTAENMAQFEAIAQNVLGAVGDLPASMSDVGKQAITDMIEGIKSMSGQLYNTVQTVVSSALQGAAQALLGGGIEAAMADVRNVTGSISTPASAYGNEGYGPGYAMDYRRMGQEMAAAMDGVAVNMDGTAVGSVVSGPVNNNLGSYNVTGGRSMH